MRVGEENAGSSSSHVIYFSEGIAGRRRRELAHALWLWPEPVKG